MAIGIQTIFKKAPPHLEDLKAADAPIIFVKSGTVSGSTVEK